MGNGQHRNRRGARPRPGPHKHGGAGNSARAATQLIPPVALASAVSGDTPADRGAGDDSGERASEPTLPATSGAPGAPDNLAEAADALAGQDAPPTDPVASSHQNHRHDGGHAPQPPLVEVEPTAAGEPAAAAGAASGSTGAAPAGRSRNDRFYAPGQGPRTERVERVAPPISPALPAVVSAPATPPRRVERVERYERPPGPGELVDEDDGPEYTGPRADVRGSVGALIDSLHEVFVRDRAIASQGGVSRCGVCYLHFPVDELVYRDAEGFYVCESCAHALGSARVSMLRRQQRQ